MGWLPGPVRGPGWGCLRMRICFARKTFPWLIFLTLSLRSKPSPELSIHFLRNHTVQSHRTRNIFPIQLGLWLCSFQKSKPHHCWAEKTFGSFLPHLALTCFREKPCLLQTLFLLSDWYQIQSQFINSTHPLQVNSKNYT